MVTDSANFLPAAVPLWKYQFPIEVKQQTVLGPVTALGLLVLVLLALVKILLILIGEWEMSNLIPTGRSILLVLVRAYLGNMANNIRNQINYQ